MITGEPPSMADAERVGAASLPVVILHALNVIVGALLLLLGIVFFWDALKEHNASYNLFMAMFLAAPLAVQVLISLGIAITDHRRTPRTSLLQIWLGPLETAASMGLLILSQNLWPGHGC